MKYTLDDLIYIMACKAIKAKGEENEILAAVAESLIELRNLKKEKNMEKGMAFVDKKCPDCDGRGYGYDADGKEQRCETCEGTGLIGSLEEMEIREGQPDNFAKMFRKLREEANVSMSEMADILGCSVVRVSDLERGKGDSRTSEEKTRMFDWICKNYPPGSGKAFEHGCICSALANIGNTRDFGYVTRPDCHLHGCGV